MAAFSSASRRIDLLPPERTRAPRPAPTRRPMIDVVDAEFEIVPTARSHAAHGAGRRPSAAHTPGGQGLLRQIERHLHQISPRVFAGLTLALCALAFLFTSTLAPAMPEAPRALGFGDVRTDVQDADGLKVLAIYGTVVNPTAVSREIPAIRIDVAASGRQMSAQAKLGGSGMLAPGESRPFSARLPHSGGTSPIVQISFAGAGAPTR
jgi:hypothetical protein